MVQVVKSHIQVVVERLRDNITMEEVIIFGSYAYGEPNDDSDIDICVIISDPNCDKRLLLKKIRRIISPLMKYPLDILVYDKSEFYERAGLSETLEHKISEEGVRVYE